MEGGPASTDLNIWPIGRYKGKPLDVVMADDSYIQWILSRPWFPEDYPRLYTLIQNFGNELQNSPEHNEFQMGFLDERLRLAVAKHIGYRDLDADTCRKKKAIARKVAGELAVPLKERELPLRVSSVGFEEDGWDVVFDILPASYVSWVDSKPHGKDYVALLESWGKSQLAARNRARLKELKGSLDVAIYEPNGARRPRVLIELKPELGDDYPSVLRQIKRYPERNPGKDRKLLIVRRASFTTVSFEQVKAFFATADVLLIREWELMDQAKEEEDWVEALEGDLED